MKILYLGTAAAEGIPALFCRCPVCQKARAIGGKEIRTRCQALVDGKLLLDFPPDTYAHYLKFSFDLPSVRHLFVTHSHSDHFYPDDLLLRQATYATQDFETLRIYGSEKVEELFMGAQFFQREMAANCYFRLMLPFSVVDADGYKVTGLPALHNRREKCLFYAIEHEGGSLLYAHDTGLFPTETWDYIAANNMKFDCVSLDCTCVKYADGGNHMGLPDDIRIRKSLFEIGAATDKTIFVLNHFSHNGGMNHDELTREAENEGFVAAWDGLEIAF